MAELSFIQSLRELATHPAARGLLDDAAVLEVGGTKLVLTHDTLVDGVHFLAGDPPETVAWKLLAVNVSDLAAKGAKPIGALMGYTLTGDDAWDQAFVAGLGKAADHFGVELLGGDTVKAKERHLSLTLIGEAQGRVPSRTGAQPGDVVYVSGVVGDAGAGLKCRLGTLKSVPEFENAYLMPRPDVVLGQRLADQVTAMMDVSDGLLIDAQRLCVASRVGIQIDLGAVPLSSAYRLHIGDDAAARISAATAGDDYVLLFTTNLPLPANPTETLITRIGQVVRGETVSLVMDGTPIPLPDKLGWLHD